MKITWIMVHNIWDPITDKYGGIHCQPPTSKKFTTSTNIDGDCWLLPRYMVATHTYTYAADKYYIRNIKFKWTEVDQKAFEDMKRLVGKYALLAYPKFSKESVIHIDTSKTQLGSVILQAKWPILLYSHKLTPLQTWYTTTERDLLSIVEILK